MTHINFNSGGIGSRTAGKRLVAEFGADNVINLFTDTLIEDRDLYRFLIETNAEFYGIDRPDELIARCDEIPDVTSEDNIAIRKTLLADISREAMHLIPQLVWIADGRTPWEVFRHKRYLGNSRLAQCSHILKQEMSRGWITANYGPDDCTLYLGIDWTEDHRRAAPIKNWAPYTVKFPMCDEPYVDKGDMLRMLDEDGIARPRLYEMGFAHNNCGGFCVRAGMGHFATLLRELPESYAYHESKEQEMRGFLGKDVTIMKKVRDKVTYRLSMKDLRQSIESERNQDVDYEDIGGCGCFVSDETGVGA